MPRSFSFGNSIVNRRQHAIVRVRAVGVNKQVDVVEYVLPYGIACYMRSPPKPLSFQELEETLYNRVVMAVFTFAYAAYQIVPTEKL